MATSKKKPAAKKKNGSPLTYTEKLGKEICEKIATSDYGLKRLCLENTHWPTRKCILHWRITLKSFGDMYAKAKQDQIETLIDDCIDIADDSGFDAHINEKGFAVCDSEAINRARLRIDTRKFLAQKLAPKIYGDKQQEDDKQDFKEALNSIKEIAKKCMKPI